MLHEMSGWEKGLFWIYAPCHDYVQDKVRPGTGREGALGYERYIAKSTWMCGAIVSELQNITILRCDCLRIAQCQGNRDRLCRSLLQKKRPQALSSNL